LPLSLISVRSSHRIAGRIVANMCPIVAAVAATARYATVARLTRTYYLGDEGETY